MSEKIKYEVITSRCGVCLAIDGYRVAGAKPLGGGTVERTFTGKKSSLIEAIAAWNDQASSWIKVEDGLPEETGEYLVLPYHKHCPTLWYQDGWYWYDEVDDAISETIGHYTEKPIFKVTHWMPIPELPKEEI